MRTDKFTKIMLVLIFLALAANLFKSFLFGGFVYADNKPIQIAGTRVYTWDYNRHYHKVVCECGGKSTEMDTSTPVSSTSKE